MSDPASHAVPGLEQPAREVMVDECANRTRQVVPFLLAPSPLGASRSLGRLLGLESLYFKLESGQPTGSWLDRSAAALVASAVASGKTGLGLVGLDGWSLPLAVQATRAGLRLVLLLPTDSGDAAAGLGLYEAVNPNERGWLTALGTHIIAVEADLPGLRETAPLAMQRAGLHLVTASDPRLTVGLQDVIGEVENAGHGAKLLVVPALTGQEWECLATIADCRSGAVPLTLNGLAPSDTRSPIAIVGAFGWPPVVAMDAPVRDEADLRGEAVLAVSVTAREADAARRLLAREEGLLVSRRGGAGLAALVRALREDRARRPRERRLRQVTGAVVVVTGEPMRAGDGPPLTSDAVSSRPVSLALLSADLSRLLVEPPSR